MSGMNQGLPVAGYKAQTDTAVSMVNQNKALEETVLRIIDAAQKDGIGDPRWLAIARTDIEKAFMSLNRAIFRPGRIKLPGDPE